MYMFYYLKKYFYYCNKLNGDEKFEQWNDTSVAHMFIRLMTKSNHPYNDNMPLSREQFDADYELLENYINWRKNKHIVQHNNSSYNYTIDSMLYLLNRIDYDTQNLGEVSQLWNNMLRKNSDVEVMNNC